MKRGRGSQRKIKVPVMAESETVASPARGQKPRSVGYLKMKVIDDLKKETINKAVKELAAGAQEVDMDHPTSYVELKDFVPGDTTLRLSPKRKWTRSCPGFISPSAMPSDS